MDVQEREALLHVPEVAVLAMVDLHGRAHAVPIWYRWDGATLRMITDPGTAKLRYLDRNARAALCIDARDGSFRHVTAEGPVAFERVTYEERLAMHMRYREPEAAKATVDAGGHEQLVLIVLTPERWY